MYASAIFVVGTSGIPPKLNYRSVKSYTILGMTQIAPLEKPLTNFKFVTSKKKKKQQQKTIHRLKEKRKT